MLINKIRNKSLFNILKVILKRIELIIKAPIWRLVQYRNLELNNYSVNFVHEGSKIVKIPRVPFLKVLFGIGILVKRNSRYVDRPYAEILLRKTIYDLYQNGYIDSALSIIDIGSWIADNSIVWSKKLNQEAIVFAIDPSPENQSYAQKIARLNDVSNITFIEAVCTDNDGDKVDFDGDLDHTSFQKKPTDGKMISTTLDTIVKNSGGQVIGLLHVDVEGLEFSVLKGASNIIKSDMPVISFEQHISKENIFEVTDFLKEFGYRVFMVNEVLPGCSLDCRNFIAFPSNKTLPQITEFDQKNAAAMGIYSAVVGKSLIEI